MAALASYQSTGTVQTCKAKPMQRMELLQHAAWVLYSTAAVHDHVSVCNATSLRQLTAQARTKGRQDLVYRNLYLETLLKLFCTNCCNAAHMPCCMPSDTLSPKMRKLLCSYHPNHLSTQLSEKHADAQQEGAVRLCSLMLALQPCICHVYALLAYKGMLTKTHEHLATDLCKLFSDALQMPLQLSK